MKFKKFISAVLLIGIILSVSVSPISVFGGKYDREYGKEEYTQSSTVVSDEMTVLREKDDPNDDTSLLYTIKADGTAMITGYAGKFMEGANYEFNIPGEIDGHTVTAIGDGALCDGFAKIVGITLPPTIREIGIRAIDCRYLKYLSLNDGLEVIKDYAINCGDLLDTLVIPESVKYIGSEAISGKALKNITLPKNLEFLGKNIMFGSAYAADPKNRENNILYHGQYLLAGLQIGYVYEESSAPSAPTINKQVREWEATGDIAIREGTTMMCEDAFGMSNITSVNLPSTLKELPYLAFYWCKNLNNVVIPPNVKKIGDNAFSWCESLSNLTISEGVEEVGEAAFFRCNKLNEVTIPKSVTKIGMHAFGWDYVNDYDVRNENLVIRCYRGTAAEQYAKENGFKCILLDTGETIEKGDPTAAADDRHTCEEKGNNCAVKRFKDIQSAEGDPNHYGIEFCLDNGIITGTGAGTFSPDDSITRSQFATMFYRFAGEPESGADAGMFYDLDQEWYKKAVNWAAQNGIMNGTWTGIFSPYGIITREQIAAIFYRYAQVKGVDISLDETLNLSKSDYNDRNEISDYALIPMSWCFAENIMFLYSPDGYEYAIYPKVSPTRAETATMFYKFSYVINNS